MIALATQLQTYFSVFAPTQRDLSDHTITAYRDTWRMLITFVAARTGTSPDRLDIGDIDADNVAAFLDYLQNERGNCTATRNARLCAIRAVLSYAIVISSTTRQRFLGSCRSRPNATPNPCWSSSQPKKPMPGSPPPIEPGGLVVVTMLCSSWPSRQGGCESVNCVP